MPLILVALLAVAASPALPSDAPVANANNIVEIRVEGTRRVEPGVVRNSISSKKGAPFDATKVADDIRALWKLGYFEDIQVQVDTQPKGVILIVKVVEKPSIREVRVVGNKELSNDDLKDVVDIKAYSILDRAAVKRNLKKLQDKYVEKGYFLAEIESKILEQSDNQVDVVFEINENAKVMVKRITFVGNQHVPSEDLRSAMQTSEGDILSFITGSGTYREEVFQRDTSLVQGVYYDRGYINVKLGRPVVALSPDKHYIYITIPVDEGDQYNVGTVEFSGDLLLGKQDFQRRVAVRSGDVFSRSSLQKDILGLTDLYQDQGFAYANVTPLTDVHADTKLINLNYEIKQGQKVYIERIEITGNTKTRDRVIRRELRVYEGELFWATGVKLSKQRVNALGFFEKDSVEITQKKGSADDKIVLIVEVKEKATGTFQVGFGFSSQESFIFTAQVSQNNLFGWGMTASIGAMITGLRSLFQLSYVDPYFMDTNWILTADAYRTELDYGAFLRTAIGGVVSGGYHVSQLLQVLHFPINLEDLMIQVGYKFEEVVNQEGSYGYGAFIGGQFYGGSSYALPTTTLVCANCLRNGVTSSIKVTATLDRRDNRLFPTSGSFNSFTFEWAPHQPWFPSEFVFRQYTFNNRLYFPLPLGAVFKTNLQVGWLDGAGLPISEFYRLGGIYSLRGYQIWSVSPTEKLTSLNQPNGQLVDYPVGGNKQVIFNAELEFPIIEKVGIRGVLFFDLGNAWSTKANFFDNEWAPLPLWLGMFPDVGFGFRWFSPIGPLRFEWGIPLVRRPEIDQPINFEFTIGNSF
jgi:outer membrane protein insertion porin family